MPSASWMQDSVAAVGGVPGDAVEARLGTASGALWRAAGALGKAWRQHRGAMPLAAKKLWAQLLLELRASLLPHYPGAGRGVGSAATRQAARDHEPDG